LLNTGYSTALYKSSQRKPDWRRLCTHLTENYGRNQVMVFDSLFPLGRWQPDFYVFARYYKGESQLLRLTAIPARSSELAGCSLEPVVILFPWEDWYLTPKSKYPLLYLPSQDRKAIELASLQGLPDLQVVNFTGFAVIKLKKNSGNFTNDLRHIIDRLLDRLPRQSSLIDLYLAAASLARAQGDREWEHQLQIAENLVDAKDRDRIRRIIFAGSEAESLQE
jgi:hypothetical protein